MDPHDTLENTNRALHDLERKLSLVLATSLTHTAHLNGSVVQNPALQGLARENIQLSVLQYIRSHDGEFDAGSVYADRLQRFATSFAREYSARPEPQSNGDADSHDTSHASDDATDHGDGLQDHYQYDDYYDEFDSDEFEEQESDDMLLPPLPPRLPPREMDPDKLYGLYDFLGPDPLHCTLSRDEPVYLINDLDNYWWLIRKLTTQEKHALWARRGSHDNLDPDDEDGKIGFVPAECLETYGERLARLNCFKNEELEKLSRDTLPLQPHSDDSIAHGSADAFDYALRQADSLRLATADSFRLADSLKRTDSLAGVKRADSFATRKDAPSVEVLVTEAEPQLGRTGSILKKTRGYRPSNKLVTFENLSDIHLDDASAYSDDVDFADHYNQLSHDDVDKHPLDWESRLEILSDTYPSEVPLEVTKSTRKSDFLQPQRIHEDFQRPKFAADNISIGSFSPDTPPTHRAENHDDDTSSLRRSFILDRLSHVTSNIQSHLGDSHRDDASFGGPLDDQEPESPYDIDAHYGGDDDEDDEPFNNPYTSKEPTAPQTEEQSLAEELYDKERYDNRSFDKGLEKDLDKDRLERKFRDGYGSDGNNDEDDRLLDGHERKEEVVTPLTSMNSLSQFSPTPPDKRRTKPVHDMFSPILGKLDELTEKLAELEHML